MSIPEGAEPEPHGAARFTIWKPGRAVWREALREFLTVVFGVLVALAGQAWWQSRQDAEREASYLRQLLADTRENERLLDNAIAFDSSAGHATDLAVRALTDSAPLPSSDSLGRWIATAASASDFRGLSGTYEALLGTGDLRLVRNDTLRGLLTGYAANLNAEALRLHQLRGAVIDQAPSFARVVPFMRRIFFGPVHPTMTELQRLRNNDDAAAVFFALQASNANRLGGLRALRRQTVRLREALQRELGDTTRHTGK